MNFDSGTLERFHRDVVVAPFKSDARRELGQLGRLYEVNNDRALLGAYSRKQAQAATTAALSVVDARVGDGGPVRSFEGPVGEAWDLLQKLETNHPKIALAIRRVLRTGLGVEMSNYTLQPGSGTVYSKYSLDYGTERILFINAPGGYRGGGKRQDFVEVALANEPPVPARVVWFFEDLVKKKKVLCKWMIVQTKQHDLLRVPVCVESKPTLERSYIVCDVESITGHAHLVPDYDSNGSIMFWDVVNH